MFNAANKTIKNLLSLTLAMTLGITAATSCDGSNEKTEETQAMVLYTSADSALRAGDFKTSLALLAQIDSTYPNALDTRRKAMALRPKAIEQQCLTEFPETELALNLTMQELEQLSPKMKTVSGEGVLEPYSVVADAFNPQFIAQTTAEPRVDSKGNYYVVAQVTGTTSFGLRGVRLNTKSGSIDSDLAPGGRAIAEGGCELLSLRLEEVDTLGSRAYSLADDITSLSLIGKNGTKEVKLTPKQAHSFGTAWRYSRLLRDRERLRIRLELIERTLQTARTQIANTAIDTEEEK